MRYFFSHRQPVVYERTLNQILGPAMDSITLLRSAVAAHQAGRLDSAEELYQQVLKQDPANPDAWHLLGLAAYQSGRAEQAADLMRRAIAIRGDAEYWSNLGTVL